MKHIKWPGYLATFALVALAMALVSSPASAGNGYGRDNNPGHANGHAEGAPSSNGAQASARGSLNAAHASEQALAHANPKSRVGMLSAYMDAMAVYEAAYEDVDWDAYNDIMGQIAAIDEEIESLNEQIAALDPEDPNYEADKAALEGQIADLEDDKADLQDQADALTAEVDAAAAAAAGHLKDAANKDDMIDESVVDGVNSLLDGKSEDFSHDDIIHESEPDIAEIINPSE